MSSFSDFQPSSSEPKWNYDVFFSSSIDCFVIRSLKSSLRDAEIKTFIDDDDKKEIKPAILRAIEESRTSLIVLTKDFGDSIERLKRLQKIMKCHRRKGQVVLPIYYDVNLWEVRKQSGRFGEAFEGLVKGTCVTQKEQMRWRRDFAQITSLPRWELSHLEWSSNNAIIINSIKRILDNTSLLFIARHPVGIELRVKEVLQLCHFVENV
ncbi:disease resistance protein RLM3-like [Neltuma alba]|uniref:disease resistance protein RLM3-like n=1 Tax=Neltuma alba TaxID=207710 RepID=UPI0010A46586|nr:disease resistance protein RLM3-like [Prosopis alba]